MELNIFNRKGYLTDKERKEPLVRGLDYFTFHTNVDLSEPIVVVPYGISKKIPKIYFTRDMASFICWWTNFVHKDLNGFSGFANLKVEFKDFELI